MLIMGMIKYSLGTDTEYNDLEHNVDQEREKMMFLYPVAPHPQV